MWYRWMTIENREQLENVGCDMSTLNIEELRKGKDHHIQQDTAFQGKEK